jgi:hypothetical protein
MKLKVFVGSMIFFSSMAYSMEECFRSDYACRIAQCMQKLSTEECKYFMFALRQHPMVDCVNEFDNSECQEYTRWLCDAAASGMYDAASCAHSITKDAANQFQLSIVRSLADDSLCKSDDTSLAYGLTIAGLLALSGYGIYKFISCARGIHTLREMHRQKI